MSIDVKVPSMGESITSGILASWHVQDGDFVTAGQVLYDLETDKITSEGQAEAAGKISLKVAQGDEVNIGQVIATIDETAQGPATAALAKPSGQESAKTPPPPAPSAPVKHEAVSPAVRRISEETGLSPETVEGTGKAGRVTKGDMIAALEKQPQTPPSKEPYGAIPTQKAPQIEGRTTRKKMTPLRRKIAERLVAAKQEAAMLTTFNEVDMSAVMAARKKYQEKFSEAHGVKLGFMSFFVKASVKALQLFPAINAQIDGDEIVQNNFYDIGVAVGGPKGLMVPVVRECDKLSFSGIEKDIISYAKKVRDGKITIEDLEGGVFTITNGGIYGSMLSTPILNAPQSAILGMHNIKERAVVVDGEIVIRPMMYLALSYDHRIVDGKEAVSFLNAIKDLIEDPLRLLFEIS
ncbi:MAG: dihydrolipoyllysine-residue succinyltransferase [Verrucomicrobia bacterium]|nr:MAG: dihydrolipoyllysine-residue succinyltransferase [Verrucomicrobiota bacterium]